MQVNWIDTWKGRCSAISVITSESRSSAKLTEKQVERVKELESKEKITENQKNELAELLLKHENSKIVTLSDTYIAYLMEEYAWHNDKMLSVNKDLDTHAIQKGKLVEKDAVELLSIADGTIYNYNEQKQRIYNEYLSGEVDCWEGESIETAETIIDIKNIWDYIGYLVKINQPLSKANKQQVQGYMLISSAPKGYIADCLLDTPEEIKYNLRQKLLYKGNYISEESEDFIFDWQMYERSMTFSDKLNPKQRTNKKPVEPFTETEIQFLYDQVKRGRDFLNQFHEQRLKLA